MQEYLYRIVATRPAMLTEGPTPTEADIMSRHFSYLQELLARGTLILAGRTLNTDETTMGIAVFKAESEEAAREIMNNDPAVKEGVMHATLFPYRVALISEANVNRD